MRSARQSPRRDTGRSLCHILYPICACNSPVLNDKKGHALMREPLDMATIALVDDDRNILTSVSIALEVGRLPGRDLHRRRIGAGGPGGAPAEPGHLRHQDAAHGRHGAAAPAAPEVRPAGDLPDLQGRRDRRAVRPEDGRRRFHHASRSRSVCWSSASRRCCAAPAPARPRSRAPSQPGPVARARPAGAWTRNATPAPGRASR